jgi:YspA, cpYpsA-related SLOG family
MVLLHGGSPRGAERIAACWADNRKVPQVVFKPDWTRHRNAAPFKRNDQMLEALPISVVVFPGSRHLRQPRRQGPQDGHPGAAFC